MVCDAVCEALEDLDLLEEDDEDEDVAMMAQMAQPVMASYRKGSRYEDDVDYPEVYVYMDYAIACLESLSTKPTFKSLAMNCFSFCKPSRGPTSVMMTSVGRVVR